MEKTEVSLTPELARSYITAIKSSYSNREKAMLATVLGIVCQIQKQYGKTTDDFLTTVEAWCWALDGYPMDKIIAALREHTRRSPDIPTPSDVVNILNEKSRTGVTRV